MHYFLIYSFFLKLFSFCGLLLQEPTFFDGNGGFLLPQSKEDEEEYQWDEDLKGQNPLK